MQVKKHGKNSDSINQPKLKPWLIIQCSSTSFIINLPVHQNLIPGFHHLVYEKFQDISGPP